MFAETLSLNAGFAHFLSFQFHVHGTLINAPEMQTNLASDVQKWHACSALQKTARPLLLLISASGQR